MALSTAEDARFRETIKFLMNDIKAVVAGSLTRCPAGRERVEKSEALLMAQSEYELGFVGRRAAIPVAAESHQREI